MAGAVARHYEILDAAVVAHGGVRPIEQGEGDSIVAAFGTASDAIGAALDAQRRLTVEPWAASSPLAVRIAVHAGEARLRDEGNYAGPAIIRTARLRAIAHGGDGAGLGTMWGEQTPRRMLAEAGFTDVTVERVEGDVFNVYYIARKS